MARRNPLNRPTSRTDDPRRAIPVQAGRRFVVTGANSGIGLALAERLVESGAHVVMACRDERRGEAAADTIRATSLPGTVEVAVLDLSDLASVRRFTENLDGEIDVLVNNAGVLGVPWRHSADGHEMHFATNHLGHFALANRLLPRVRDRVVVVTSQAHRGGELDLDDLQWRRREYKPFAAYQQSKMANTLFLGELQRRLTAAGSTVRSVGAHPGTTSSNITSGTGTGWKTWVGSWGHQLVGMPAWKGALPVAYAATFDLPGNSFVGPDGPGEMFGWPTLVGRAPAALDVELSRRLWEESELLTGETFPL
ncbi:oxidoreductase [Nocardioides sp. R-C-SC26]|uniref:oxidoreductase n=1 Tax=Nocardioides sp. R-C-SC26 TaxID=2870414 RepID=UPI001E61C1A8|nr:oxidoreductase [Nocardioides sp. R-C-SC26]